MKQMPGLLAVLCAVIAQMVQAASPQQIGFPLHVSVESALVRMLPSADAFTRVTGGSPGQRHPRWKGELTPLQQPGCIPDLNRDEDIWTSVPQTSLP